MFEAFRTIPISVVLISLFAQPVPTAWAVQQSGVTAFENVTVIPMDRERTIERQTVVVQGGRITAIGSSETVRVPDGAVRIDGSKKFLMPGLAEMHGHIPPPRAGEDYLDRVLFLFLANGVTTVRGMLGNPQHLVLRDQVARGERLGPRIFTSGPSLNGNSVPGQEAAWRAVTDQRAAGYDLLKLHPGLSREAFDAIVATANREGILFAGHVSLGVGLERALEAGQSSVEHLDGYMEALLADGAPVDRVSSNFFGFNLIDHVDESKIPDLAETTQKAGVWNTTTQVLFEHWLSLEDPETLAQRPEMRYMPEQMVASWVRRARNTRGNPAFTPERARRFVEVRRKIIRALRDAGAGILLGADTPQIFNVPGFATLQELKALVTAGLTPYQALEAGTKNPALYFGLEESFGTVEVGKRADLILLEANPLEDIGNVGRNTGVMVGGRWLSREEIERRLQELASEDM